MTGGESKAGKWGEWFRGHLALAILAAILLQLVEGWYYGRDLEKRITTIEIELQEVHESLTPAHK